MLYEKTDVFLSIKPSKCIVAVAHNQIMKLTMSTTCLLNVKLHQLKKNNWTASDSVSLEESNQSRCLAGFNEKSDQVQSHRQNLKYKLSTRCI